jgi:hypothetical protein
VQWVKDRTSLGLREISHSLRENSRSEAAQQGLERDRQEDPLADSLIR